MLTSDIRDTVFELFATCEYTKLKGVNGYRFKNGLDITQSPCGNTKYVYNYFQEYYQI